MCARRQRKQRKVKQRWPGNQRCGYSIDQRRTEKENLRTETGELLYDVKYQVDFALECEVGYLNVKVGVDASWNLDDGVQSGVDVT